MIKQIAVYVGETGEWISLQDKGRVVIYEKTQGQWEIIGEVEFNWEKSQGTLKEMRQMAEEMLKALGDCRIFTALSVSGVPYHVLEKAGFRIWECEGQPREFLDDILNQEEEALLECQKEVKGIPAPVDLGNGFFTISLKEIQQKNSQFTSKQVLLPFLRQGQFYSLEIICSYLPKWLELELLGEEFTSQVEQIKPGELKVILAKKVCQ